ncbi:MAG: flippase-like domain-containing protein [Elusimicrobia bacterium]|nr:flippase-like domain-containing protein [Elusimicrobiota bacterium]
MKQGARWALSAGLTLLGLVVAFHGVDWGVFSLSLRRTGALWGLALVPVVMGVEYRLRTARWSLLMGGARGYFPVVAAAFFLNTVLPFRAGEAARAYWSHRRSGRSLSGCVAGLVVDRLGDALALLGVFAVFLFHVGDRTPGSKIGALVFVLAIALAALGIGVRWPETVRKKLLPGGSPPLWVRIVEGVLAGVAPLRAGRIALGVGALSGMVWTLNVFLYWWVAGLFGIDLSLSQAGGVLAAIALGVALPSTPGFVGVYEAAGVLMLGSLGIEKERALAFVLALHGAQIIGAAVWGGPSLWLLGRGEGDASRAVSGIDKIQRPS